MKPEPGELFREVQRFRQWWVLLLVIGLAGLAWYASVQQVILAAPFGSKPAPDIILYLTVALIGIGLPWFMFAMKMTTVVRVDRIDIRFFPLHSRSIPFTEIRSYRVREYRPILEYGGWGIRMTRKNGRAYNVSGKQGLQLELVDGKKILIGTQKAEELMEALRQAIEL
jgi:hypothetical protein